MAMDQKLKDTESSTYAEVMQMEDLKADQDVAGLDATNLPIYDDKKTKRILRKVDVRLLPILTLLYIISTLDKGNIGNAKVAGMNKDLGLTDYQYNMALTMFFLPYAIFEVPSNIMLKIMTPSTWMTILVMSWGTVMVCQGLVKNGGGLIATRVMLGVCEAGFFPAASFLVGEWYCRFELQWRLAVFFSAASLAGAFSGLLAFALEEMDGIGGLAGWRWIFIIEGIISVVVGATLHWTLPDSPSTASFLSNEEKDFIKRRLEEDTGTSEGRLLNEAKFQWRWVWATLGDWRIWFTVFVYWGNTIPVYAFSFTAPTIILNLGYTAAQAQLLTIPIYVLGAISTLAFSWVAEKHQRRWPFIIAPYSIALVGAIGLISTPRSLPGLTYAFLFCIPSGVYPAVITLVSWVSNNLAPSWKRSIGIAMSIMMGNFGGAIGSNIYIAREAPNYWTGYGMTLATLVVAIFCTLVLRYVWKRANDERDKMTLEEIRAKYTEQQLLELGDRSPLYRYIL